jgi:hypothetical protein
VDTLCEGLDVFESEIPEHSVRRAARASVRRPTTFRRQSSALVPAAHVDSPPVIRVAMVGVPAWARRVRVVPAIALMLWAAAGISVGAAHVLSQRLPEPLPAPRPAIARPAGAPTLLSVIVEAVPKEPAKE